MCNRCRGQLFFIQDNSGDYYSCLQCGNIVEKTVLEPLPLSRNKKRSASYVEYTYADKI